ncbi:TRAP transporter large permease [Alloalcanivorax mobilis]|uniref:TRAP transporter large permease n=1 Tax=Alloalcanivorax mobilis TaxID=2019569 RepID=UPI000B5B3FAD|nr:TRAP transporter large permease [Alloalcanivorax mobilis]ASK35637.1 C4-dicarboxylate ABC transporter [Alcanivorax sp. N3-2A]|tara:strand:- start:50 stop:1357 length:1308 start_codon:yes stop_codon:yes gene_type:complete
MSDVQIGLSALGLLLFLIAMRVPIGIALIGVSFGGLWYLMGWGVAWGSLGLIPYQFAANWVLSSVPMFLLLGFICFHAQLTQGLFRAARLWLAGVPGGLAVASIFGSAGFAAVSGSSVACSAAMGRIAVPEMVRHGYQPQLATGTVAVAGTIGALIPPSIIMILYGIIAQVPITGLFLGGISAGILTAAGYIAVVMIRVKLNPALAPQVKEDVPTSEKLAALRETWPVLLIMVGIFGGLFGGVFTATEAGAVGAFLSCIVALCKRALTWERFKNAVLETLLTTGALLVIAVGASLLTRFLSLSGAGDYLSEMVIGGGASTVMILFMIVVIYLLLGMFLEPIGAMLLTLPIVLPIIGAADLSLLWFGVVLTKLLEIGMITPPIGMNVFVIKGVVGDLASTTDIFKGIFWFLVMDLLVLLFLITVPEFILFLPTRFG